MSPSSPKTGPIIWGAIITGVLTCSGVLGASYVTANAQRASDAAQREFALTIASKSEECTKMYIMLDSVVDLDGMKQRARSIANQNMSVAL